ncbi:MAG: hypothetical protein AN484_08500 [Aphanizomenon flos-aquae WA102]|uniref:Uncharacterized protein n=1 Tax=Aphanizomenon flos-aquae WA102 TaxID=1710896 RepID=A0A1B7X455_APHFL|nr:MAG: hypothetical protein AN484_08500 [Aphanizomenon flos-aquae WA102]
MEWSQNFYLGTHSHYQNITPHAASQRVRTQKKENFFNFFLIFLKLAPINSKFCDSAMITQMNILSILIQRFYFTFE